ncbi:hypothetical protein ABW21_db0205818 [Orbilia brochopaga]|nr:hypothetical protein ABW21_db0205818 [Drechslerella brochopaga]
MVLGERRDGKQMDNGRQYRNQYKLGNFRCFYERQRNATWTGDQWQPVPQARPHGRFSAGLWQNNESRVETKGVAQQRKDRVEPVGVIGCLHNDIDSTSPRPPERGERFSFTEEWTYQGWSGKSCRRARCRREMRG